MRKNLAKLKPIQTIFFAIFLTVWNCNLDEPVNIKQGEYRCEHCQMNIVKLQFHSQVITNKGKKLHFDSIECMTSYGIKNPEKIKSSWVKNFLHFEKWIPLEKSFLVQSANIPSPMRANLSSYESLEEAENQIKKYGGRIIHLQELKEFIAKEWEKEISNQK